MKFKIISFNKIQNHIFQYNSESCLSIKFKIKTLYEILSLDDETALHLAAYKGNVEIVKILLEQDNIDINAENEIHHLF